jgi:hypothetical protein
MGKTTTKGTRYKCYSVGTLLFKTTDASLTRFGRCETQSCNAN